MYYRVIIILFILIQCTGARDECIHQLEQKTSTRRFFIGLVYADRPTRDSCVGALLIATSNNDESVFLNDRGLFDYALLQCVRAELNYRKCKKYPTDLPVMSSE